MNIIKLGNGEERVLKNREEKIVGRIDIFIVTSGVWYRVLNMFGLVYEGFLLYMFIYLCLELSGV